MDSQDATSFAAVEAIKAGEWDKHLMYLHAVIKERLELIDPDRPPKQRLSKGQGWAWMNGPGTPHWRIVGMGLLPETEKTDS